MSWKTAVIVRKGAVRQTRLITQVNGNFPLDARNLVADYAKQETVFRYCYYLRHQDSHILAQYQEQDNEACPANTRRWPNVGLMLAHLRRRWANNNPTHRFNLKS